MPPLLRRVSAWHTGRAGGYFHKRPVYRRAIHMTRRTHGGERGTAPFRRGVRAVKKLFRKPFYGKKKTGKLR